MLPASFGTWGTSIPAARTLQRCKKRLKALLTEFKLKILSQLNSFFLALIPHGHPNGHARSLPFLRFDLKASVVDLQSLSNAEEPEAAVGRG